MPRTPLPELFALTAGVALIARNLPHGARAATTALTATIAAVGTLLVFVWPPGNRYDTWRTMVLDAPPALQSLAAAILLVAPAAIVVRELASRPRSRVFVGALAACVCTWTIVHTLLPMHLSSQDFDDLFVVGKFVGAATPDWYNDKPWFTVWDLAYRWMDDVDTTDPLGLTRFRVNGWYAMVYMLAVALWLERATTTKLRWMPWVAALHLGPVMLSHTLQYELPGGTWVLVVCLAIERLRRDPHVGSNLEVVAFAALARILHAGGHNATALGWVPVYAHAVLTLRRRRAHPALIVWACALGASALLQGATRQRASIVGAVDAFTRDEVHVVLFGGVFPLLAAVVWLWRAKHPRWNPHTLLALAWRRPLQAHTWLVYFACGAAIYLVANHGKFGVPIPGWRTFWDAQQWDYATNHARYAMYFYPWLATLVLGVAPRTRGGLVALGLVALAWNLAYVTRFYAAPRDVVPADLAYMSNNRYVDVARAARSSLPHEARVAWVPIPRDHGDHYLFLSVDPTWTLVSACTLDPVRDAHVPLLITDHTLGVTLKGERAVRLLDARHLQRRVRILRLHMRDLSSAALASWCAQPRLLAPAVR